MMAGSGRRVKDVHFIILLHLAFACAKDYAPVLVWNSKSLAKDHQLVSALRKLTLSEFEADFLVHLHEKKVLLFLQDSLSVEDFSLHSGTEISFPELQQHLNKSNVVFLPAVHSANKIPHYLESRGYKVHHFKVGEDPLELNLLEKDLVVVRLSEIQKDGKRGEILKENDAAISSIYKKFLEQDAETAAIFTANHASWLSSEKEEMHFTRRILQDSGDDEGDNLGQFFNYSDTVYIYTNNVTYFTIWPENDTRIDVALTKNNVTGNAGNKSRTITITSRAVTAGNLSLDFVIVNIKFAVIGYGDWIVSNIILKVKGKYKDESINSDYTLNPKKISAPMGYSYHCDTLGMFTVQNVSNVDYRVGITFPGFQVQPYHLNAKEGRFSDAIDCVPFFTHPIWAGIFVTLMFGIILSWGLYMVMDIKTMDRFDDPKGKTIYVPLSE